jgi:hypothetical protein
MRTAIQFLQLAMRSLPILAVSTTWTCGTLLGKGCIHHSSDQPQRGVMGMKAEHYVVTQG